jgi:predicted transcriptional regulator
MTKKKKKSYKVICEVNMDASHMETVIVKATKKELAMKQAERKLYDTTEYFLVSARSCEELPD